MIVDRTRIKLPLLKPPKRKRWSTRVATNLIYSGIHYISRNKLKDSYHRAPIKLNKIDSSKYPVTLLFNFVFKNRPLDSSNTSFMAKMFEDSMVEKGILSNDTIKYIYEVRLRATLDKSIEDEYLDIIILDDHDYV